MTAVSFSNARVHTDDSTRTSSGVDGAAVALADGKWKTSPSEILPRRSMETGSSFIRGLPNAVEGGEEEAEGPDRWSQRFPRSPLLGDDSRLVSKDSGRGRSFPSLLLRASLSEPGTAATGCFVNSSEPDCSGSPSERHGLVESRAGMFAGVEEMSPVKESP